MKIAYICNEYPPAPHGGIGTFVHAIAHGMASSGHEVTVVGWGREPGEREDGSVRVVTLPASRLPGVGWLVNRRRLHRWLQGQVQAGRIELIETPDYEGPMPFAFTACPVVVRLHLAATTICRQTRHRLTFSRWWAERQTLRQHPNWIAVSRYALELTLRDFEAAPRKPAIIYYPVVAGVSDGGRELVLPDEFILYAGTVSRRKGAFVLAEAARRLLTAHPCLQLVFAGAISTERGEAADVRIRRILGEELSARVCFLGRLERSQVLACMRRARAFAFPSSLETFGMVVAEAMLEGCPVVVPDAGPFPEIVEHERTGLLFPPNDSAGLAAALERVLPNGELPDALSRHGRESVKQRFSLEAAVGANLDFYRSCVADTPTLQRKHGTGIRTITPLFKRWLRAFSPKAYARLREFHNPWVRLASKVGRRQGWRVLTGPFAGMRYLDQSHGSRLVPKLLGSYEAELHSVVGELIAAKPRVIIDVGCAEGYYAVGFARSLPEANIVAFDISEEAQAMCRRLAEANGVTERVSVRSRCDCVTLSSLPLEGAVLIVDCEGYELELLQPDRVAQLARATILVELHDCFVPGLSKQLLERFRSTHDVRLVPIQGRNPGEYSTLRELSERDQWRAVDEDRRFDGQPIVQHWALLEPRDSGKERLAA